MKLYQFAPSPNCQKVVALAHEAGVHLDTVDLDVFGGAARTKDMLLRNPNGKVPVLEDGDLVLWESNAMLGYVAAKADRADLAPGAARERAEVDRWLFWQGAHFGPAVRKVAFELIVKKLAGLGPADEAEIAKGRAEFEAVARVLDRALAGREHLCGRLTIADFAMVPYAALAEPCGLDLDPYPSARAWLARMVARDSVKRALAAARGAG